MALVDGEPFSSGRRKGAGVTVGVLLGVFVKVLGGVGVGLFGAGGILVGAGVGVTLT